MGEYRQDERSFYNETCLVTGDQSEEAPRDLLIIHNNALNFYNTVARRFGPWHFAIQHKKRHEP